MYFENPDKSKYHEIPGQNGNTNIPWLPMPIYPNGPGSIDVKLHDASRAEIENSNPGVVSFEIVSSRRQDPAVMRIFGLGVGHTRIAARRSRPFQVAAVDVSVFNLMFPRLHIWFASDHQPSVNPQDAPRMIRALNAVVGPYTGIYYRQGRAENVELGVDVAKVTGNGAVPSQAHWDAVKDRLREIPRQMGTSGQLNVVIVRNLALTLFSAGYAPDQPGDIAIVGENVKLPQTVASTMAHELGHCLGVDGKHLGEDDNRTLMHGAPTGALITKSIALIMRKGAAGR